MFWVLKPAGYIWAEMVFLGLVQHGNFGGFL